MSKKDYYDILGVDRNATDNEIKKRYRTLCKENHPDVGGDENVFKDISEAYETLSNAEKRRNYDAYGHNKQNGYNPFGGMNMADMLRNFGFGSNRNSVKRGRDLRVTINLTLEEVFTGTKKTFKYNRNSPCKSCNGDGGYGRSTCNRCNGNGKVIEQMQTPVGIFQNIVLCNSCNGSGYSIVDTCGSCNGNGVTREEEEITIDMPIGIMDGNALTFSGMGDGVKGGQSGDLIIQINELKHDKFIREGDNLKYNLKLSYPQLVLGDKIEVPMIDGSKVLVKIPEYSKLTDTLRLPSKGLISLNGSKGDYYISLNIELPNKIDDEERELLIELKKIKEKVA